MDNKYVIAIDGPASAGKSTIAKIIAKKLGYTYIDTGAMYRSLALYSIYKNIDINDVDALVEGAKKCVIELDNEGHVFLDNEDVTTRIRQNDVNALCSPVSAPRAVREIMVKKQQEFAKNSKVGVVMDGRDIGTVVLTDADLKIYQTASVESRAERRYKENIEKGIPVESMEKLIEEINHRDYLDMNKGFGALKQAEDAIYLDTSDMTIDEVVHFILNKIEELKK